MKSKSMKFFSICFTELFTICSYSQVLTIFMSIEQTPQEKMREELRTQLKAFFTLFERFLATSNFEIKILSKIEESLRAAKKAISTSSAKDNKF